MQWRPVISTLHYNPQLVQDLKLMALERDHRLYIRELVNRRNWQALMCSWQVTIVITVLGWSCMSTLVSGWGRKEEELKENESGQILYFTTSDSIDFDSRFAL